MDATLNFNQARRQVINAEAGVIKSLWEKKAAEKLS